MAMRICFDTEFIEDGRTIELLSIGMIRSDGAVYYAELEADTSKASPWVVEHVLPYLDGRTIPRAQAAQEIKEFVGTTPRFWAWYADYDWVALCQLYGTMMDLPKTWPMFCRDFRQEHDGVGLPDHSLVLDGPEHHALSDARWLDRAMRWHADQVVS